MRLASNVQLHCARVQNIGQPCQVSGPFYQDFFAPPLLDGKEKICKFIGRRHGLRRRACRHRNASASECQLMSSVFPALLRAQKSTTPRTTILRVHYTLPCTPASPPAASGYRGRERSPRAQMGGTNGGRLGHPTGLMPPMNPNLGVHLPTQTFFSFAGGVAAWLTCLPIGHGMLCVLAFVWMRGLRLLVNQGRKCCDLFVHDTNN